MPRRPFAYVKLCLVLSLVTGGVLDLYPREIWAGPMADALAPCAEARGLSCEGGAISQLAEAGNPVAQAYLSSLLEGNNFEPPSDEQLENSRSWLRRAADGGFPAAQTRLGRLYLSGAFGKEHDPEGLLWLQRAAAQGEPGALMGLISAYLFGIGTEKNISKASEWALKAADEGIPDAMYFLARLNASGAGGIAKNRAKAQEWLTRSAALGFAQARLDLRALKRTGRFPPEWAKDE